jgi:FkbM family methyltransferase
MINKFYELLFASVRNTINRYLLLSIIGNKLLSFKSFSFPHEVEYKEFISYLRFNEGVILDIGANFGQSSKFFLANTDKSVFAYEPFLNSFEKLKKLVSFHDRLKVFNLGFSSTKTELTFCVPKLLSYHLSTFASDVSFLPKLRMYFESRHPFLNRWVSYDLFSVACIRIDDVEAKISGIKIDVEGSELDVLKGATRTLKVQRPILIIETTHNFDKIKDFLQTFNYEVKPAKYPNKISKNSIFYPSPLS